MTNTNTAKTIEVIAGGGVVTVLVDGTYSAEYDYDVNGHGSRAFAHKKAVAHARSLGAKKLVGYCNGEIFSTDADADDATDCQYPNP